MDEAAEVCHHAEELLEFGDIHGFWESMHSINLLQIWVYTIWHHMGSIFTAGTFTCIFCGLCEGTGVKMQVFVYDIEWLFDVL